MKPPGGWHGAHNNQSAKALKCLKWIRRRLCLNDAEQNLHENRIAHAGNRGKHGIVTRARVYCVHGYDASTRNVYELHACLWRGCPRCHPNRTMISLVHPDRTTRELCEATWKTALLRCMGYTVVEEWECNWDWEAEYDLLMSEFLKDLEIVEPLNPCHAYNGETTGVTCLRQTRQKVRKCISLRSLPSIPGWRNLELILSDIRKFWQVQRHMTPLNTTDCPRLTSFHQANFLILSYRIVWGKINFSLVSCTCRTRNGTRETHVARLVCLRAYSCRTFVERYEVHARDFQSSRERLLDRGNTRSMVFPRRSRLWRQIM